jgi:RHS repeat-associated protein
VYAVDGAGNATYQRPQFDQFQYALIDPGNQRPTLSAPSATLNSNGSLNASITHVDPDNDGMRLRASLVDVNGNVVAGSTICLPDCSTYGLGNTTSSVTWSAAQMASLTTPGSSYRVRFEVADYQSTTTPIYSAMDTGLISIPIPFSVSTLQPRTGVVNTVVPVTVTGTGFTGNINLQITNQNPSPCTQVTWATTSATFNCALSATGTTWSADVRAEQSTAVKYSVAFTVTAVATPAVTSITPGSARLDVLQQYDVSGTGLTANMRFTVEDCEQVTEVAGGTSTKRSWTCIPRAPGLKVATIKDSAGGGLLNGAANVLVEHPQRLGDPASRGTPSVAGVSLFNGNLFLRFVDMVVPGRGLSFVLERTYNSYDWLYETDHGGVPSDKPWRFNFEQRIGYVPTAGNKRLYFAKADGSGESYFLSGTKWVPVDLGNFSMVVVNVDGSYTIQTRGQLSYTFESPDSATLHGRMRSMQDRDGNTISYRYNANGKVDQITDTTGRIYTVSYDPNNANRVSAVADFTGRTVLYTYAPTDMTSGRISDVYDVLGNRTSYAYNAGGDLRSILDARRNEALYVTYTAVNGNRGVQSIRTPHGTVAPGRTCNGLTNFSYCFTYSALANSAGFQTVVDGPENTGILSVTFDNAARATRIVDGESNERQTTFGSVSADVTRYAATALARTRKSPLGVAGNFATTLNIDDALGLVNSVSEPIDAATMAETSAAWVQNAAKNLHLPSLISSAAANALVSLTNSTSVGYTLSGRPNRVVAPEQYAKTGINGAATTIMWSDGTVTGVTDPMGNASTFTRTAHGYLETSTDPRNSAWVVGRTYTARGEVETVTDALGYVTRFSYYLDGALKTSTREFANPADNIRIQYFYDENRNLTKVVDARSNETIYTYDAANRLALITRTVSGRQVSRGLGYDNAGRLISVTNERNNTSYRDIDRSGRVTKDRLPLSRNTGFDYDADGRLLKMTDPEGRTVTYGYDRAGRVTRVAADEAGLNLVQRYEYYTDGKLWKSIDQKGNATEYGYDGNGNLTSANDAMGGTSTAKYDDANRMTERTDPRGKTTSYTYDKAGNLLTERDPLGNVWEYEYDSNNNLIKVKNPDLDVVTGEKRTIRHEYDEANRRKRTLYSDGADVVYTYDGNGNLVQMRDTVGTTRYSYDEANRLKSFTDPFNNSVGYDYDDAGNRIQVMYPGNRPVNYTYDNAERMLTVRDWVSNADHQYEYNLADQITRLTHPNGTYVQYGYDAAGRKTSVHNAKADGAAISSHVHTLDPTGRIVRADETLPLQPTLAPRVRRWTVDDANRVVTDVVSGDTFDHDLAGRMVRQVVGGVTTDFVHSDLDLLKSVSRPGLSESNRYNGQGHRLERTVNGSTTRLLTEPNGAMQQMLAELDVNSIAQRYYIYGVDGLLAQIDASGGRIAYAFTPMGHTVSLSNSAGASVAAYEPVFSTTVSTPMANGVSNPFVFGGRHGIQTEASGLLNVRARYLSPLAGRFLSRDPIRGGIGQSDTMNSYSYSMGDEFNFVDPTGLARDGADPYAGYTVGPDGTPHAPDVDRTGEADGYLDVRARQWNSIGRCDGQGFTYYSVCLAAKVDFAVMIGVDGANLALAVTPAGFARGGVEGVVSTTTARVMESIAVKGTTTTTELVALKSTHVGVLVAPEKYLVSDIGLESAKGFKDAGLHAATYSKVLKTEVAATDVAKVKIAAISGGPEIHAVAVFDKQRNLIALAETKFKKLNADFSSWKAEATSKATEYFGKIWGKK